MIELSLGKYRALQQSSTKLGAISILALDHRNNLRNAINAQSPESVTDAEMVSFKRQVVENLAPVATAVLLDPEVGAAQCIVNNSLPGEVGLISALEATGYTGEPSSRVCQILPGWNVAKACRMGVTGIKLLVYYHPEAQAAREVENLVVEVSKDCSEQEIPFFLEPLSYSLNPDRKKLDPQERYEVVIESAKRLAVPGVDVLKAEFPLDVRLEPDEDRWAEACAKLTSVCPVPWVLLSASVDFDVYLKQVSIACQNGASGVAVGRAVWKEATSLWGNDREAFLRQVALPRMERITSLCQALARPWTDYYSPPKITTHWYKNY